MKLRCIGTGLNILTGVVSWIYYFNWLIVISELVDRQMRVIDVVCWIIIGYFLRV